MAAQGEGLPAVHPDGLEHPVADDQAVVEGRDARLLERREATVQPDDAHRGDHRDVDFDLSDEQEAFRRVVRDFAEREIAPHAEAWDRDHTFPVDTVRAMGDLGLFGLRFPEEYGGSNADFPTFCLAVEELGRVDSSMAITLEAGVGLGANPIYTYGTEEQKSRWLPDLCAGRALGAFGLTEPDGGSDAGATRTRAELVDGDWVINGAKAFITNSGTVITSIVTVTARTGGSERP